MSSQPAYSAALANQVSETQRDEWRPLNLIFVFDVGDTLMLNGATLRFFRYARVLRQRGHRVYFLVPEWSYNEGILQQLVDRGDIDGFSRLTAYYAQGWVNSVSKIFVHPRIRNRMLRNQQQDALHSLLEAIERWQCDLIVLSNRMYLFAIRELQERASVVIDWGDSFALAWWRTLKLKLRRRQMKGLGYAIRMLGGHILEEGYYPAFADANVVVSPVDKNAIDRLSRAQERVYINPNGISFPESFPQGRRDPNRIIFTGWMSFPPNHDAALWFLDEIFPLVLKARPETKFVIAGAEPPSDLLARSSARVFVYCHSVHREILDLLVEAAGRLLHDAVHRVAGMKTVLICHREEPQNRVALARWLASFSELAGVMILEETRDRKMRRFRRELKRVGWLRFLDVIAFRLYYRLFLAASDRQWEESAIAAISAKYPEPGPATQYLITTSPNTEEGTAFLKRCSPDLVIARCKQILSERVFTIPRRGTLVMHPGVCPEYRNAHGCFWALANRELDKVGMTLLQIDKGVDTGPIYGYYSYRYDEVAESHFIIQSRVVLDNLDALREKLAEVNEGCATRINVSGRRSIEWGQPWLTRYLKWKADARRGRGRGQ